MRLASALGLEAANVETTTVGGRKLLIVERYDRCVHDDGTVDRIHQEDFCQATGMPPSKKYQEDGGPSLVRVAGILGQAATADSLDRLLRAVTLNVAVGNGDAYAKNFSLLHEEGGRLRLAPAYDVMSTTVYGDQRLAMYVDTLQLTEQVTARRLVAEGSSWGMSRGHAAEVVSDLLDRLPAALETARRQTPDMPARFLSVIQGQVERLRS